MKLLFELLGAWSLFSHVASFLTKLVQLAVSEDQPNIVQAPPTVVILLKKVIMKYKPASEKDLSD